MSHNRMRQVLLSLLLLAGRIAAFSVDNQRVFLSTPVSHWPKRRVGDCMSLTPITLQPTQSVQDAMAILYANRITGAPVVDENLQVVGVVSNFDFLWEEAFEGSLLPLDGTHGDEAYARVARKICAQTVQEVMSDVSNSLYTVTPRTTMKHAAELMTKVKLHHLPVVDEDSYQLVGVITSSDIVKDLLHIVRNLPPAAMQQESKTETNDNSNEPTEADLSP